MLIDQDRLEVFRESIWWEKVLDNDDQLRQRVAYALSQILVVSYDSPAGNTLRFRGESLINYYDILVKHSFGNYRDLLKDIAMSSTMGYYLTYVGNKKADLVKGTSPDENFAREVMQLFTIGLYELNLDGTKKLDSNGQLIPSYSQDDVSELAKVFTGWDFQDKDNSSRYGSTNKHDNSQVVPLEFTEEYHEFSAKTVLGETIEANLSGEADMSRALDILFESENIAPYISRHLIMRLVTSNPTPEYIERVATVFNDNGDGVKGDLEVVVKAILLDDEARGVSKINNVGKVDELLLAYTHFLKSFKAYPSTNWEFWNGTEPRKKMTNRYWLDSEYDFGQAVLSAPSVFNFYSSDFIPSNSYFAENSLVSPELEIQNTPNLISFSNTIARLFIQEKYRILTLGLNGGSDFTDMASWVESKTRTKYSSQNINLDLTEEYNIFELAIDENIDGDFANIDNNSSLQIGIETLIDHLGTKLLGKEFPEDYKTELTNYLLTIHTNRNIIKAQYIVTEAIRVISTSPYYMVLK